MAEDKDSKQPEWEVAEPEQVQDEDELLIPLKRAIKVNETDYQSIKIRYPNRGDIKRMNKQKKIKKLDEDDMTEFLLMNLAIEPQMTPPDMEKIAISDFLYAQKKLDESGFFGIVKKET